MLVECIFGVGGFGEGMWGKEVVRGVLCDVLLEGCWRRSWLYVIDFRDVDLWDWGEVGTERRGNVRDDTGTGTGTGKKVEVVHVEERKVTNSGKLN